MTLGEVKIESLKIMFANGAHDIGVETLEDLEIESEYNDYLVNMNGSINRCFAVLEAKKVLPLKVFKITNASRLGNVLEGINGIVVDTSQIEDFYDIERVVYENVEGDYVGSYGFKREGSNILLPSITHNEEFRILYYPKMARIYPYTPIDRVLAVPNEIANLIPYFVKGELFREEEPNEASEAMNWFEQAVNQIQREQSTQTKVESKYSFMEV